VTSLPIVQRELLVAARRRLTFWSRIVAAGGGFLAVVMIVGVEPDAAKAGALGAKLFRWLTFPAFAICLFGGALLTADCLSVEKREGTLGLLFLTDLKGYDVVLGKFVAHSLTAAFCLLAIVPMLALTILLGGVTAGEFWRAVILLLNALFVSLCVGVVVSVWSVSARNALATAVFLIFIWLVWPWLISHFSPRYLRHVPALFNPITSLVNVFSTPIQRTDMFFGSIAVQHCIGWVCLGIASRRVQKSWHEQQKFRPAQNRWREWLRGNPVERLTQRRALLPINPILWLETRDWLLRHLLTGLCIFLALGGWLLNSGRRLNWSSLDDAAVTMLVLYCVIALLIALEAGARLVIARNDSALTVVLSTRLSVEEILRGERLALLRTFGPALLVVLGFDVVWLLFSLAHDSATAVAATGAAFCAAGVLVANCWAVSWAALYGGLRSKRGHRAALRAYFNVVLLPLLMFYLLATSHVLKNFTGTVFAFTALNLAAAWLFGTTARDRLKQEFREALTEHRPKVQKDFGEDYAILK
jgi:hypothetical protein